MSVPEHPMKVPDPKTFRQIVEQMNQPIRGLDRDALRAIRNVGAHLDSTSMNSVAKVAAQMGKQMEALNGNMNRSFAELARQMARDRKRVEESFKRAYEAAAGLPAETDQPVDQQELPLSEVEGNSSPKIHKPAGHVALKLTRFFYTRETFERVFQAAILDFQAEHYEALAEGDRLKAGLRRVQLVFLVVWLVICHGVQKLLKPIEPVLSVFRGG